MNQDLTKLEMQAITQNASATATEQWLTRLQKQLDEEEDENDDRHVEVVNEIETLMDELKSRHDTLSETVDDLQAQVDHNNNRTSEKGFTLMGQVTQLNMNLTQLKEMWMDQSVASDKKNEELREWVENIDNQLDTEIEYSKRKDQGWVEDFPMHILALRGV